MSRVNEQILQNFATFLNRNMGLHFRKERLSELEQRMTALGREQGYGNPNDYLVKILSAPPCREQIDLLARALTIGETYFLRDPKSYRVLEEKLLPELVALHRNDRILRIWSAGCSSGEEPYSIAILLARGLPDLAKWQLTLLASDINPQALERGRQGIYTRWSFRNAPGWLFDYFTKHPDGRYQISEEIRSMVRFKKLNLVEEASWRGVPGGMDIIFCRNVMLYFNPAQIENTMARFHAALNDGGWLFVGPTEINHHNYRGFSCRHFEGALVLRKVAGEPFGVASREPLALCRPRGGSPGRAAGASGPSAGASAPPAAVSGPSAAASVALRAAPQAPPVAAQAPRGASSGNADAKPERSAADPCQEAAALYQAGRYQEAADRALQLAEGEHAGAALALAARALANIGRFAEARECCERAIAIEKLSAQSHYLLSIILEQQGDLAGAMQALKRSLFIDHDFLLAYFAMGNLCRQIGNRRESQRNYGTALRLLERRHPHEVLPEADGMTAGRLAEMIRGLTGEGRG